MIERFVQVESGLPRSKLIDRARSQLDIDTNEAIGLFVRLWIAVLATRSGGCLGERSDRWIEEESGWRGAPGAFGAFVREHHLDEHGCIRDWKAKYGKLDIERQKANEWKRRQRSREKLTGVDGPADSLVDESVVSSAVSSGQSNGQSADSPPISSISLSSVSRSDLALGEGEPERERDEGRAAALHVVLARFAEHAKYPLGLVRASRNPEAVAATLVSHLDGMHGPAYAPEVIALAAQEYAASDESSAGFKPRLFAGFVRRAEGTVKLTESRKQQQNETRFIRREVEQHDAIGDEIAAEAKLINEFKIEHFGTYAELLDESERAVPPKWKGPLRGPMVRTELARRIREWDDNQQGGARAAR